MQLVGNPPVIVVTHVPAIPRLHFGLSAIVPTNLDTSTLERPSKLMRSRPRKWAGILSNTHDSPLRWEVGEA